MCQLQWGTFHDLFKPVNESCRICQVHLSRGIRPLYNDCSGYDSELSDGEAPVLELRGMQSTLSLLLLLGPLWPGVVVPVKTHICVK